MAKYTAKIAVWCGGEHYPEGAVIELSADAAQYLLDVDAIEPEPKAEPKAKAQAKAQQPD